MKEWSPEEELRLFRALCQFKPVGKLKHFHMMSILKTINIEDKPEITAEEVWGKLRILYDLEGLDELEDDSDDDSENEEEEEDQEDDSETKKETKPELDGHKIPVKMEQFELPWDDYGELMMSRAKNEASNSVSASPTPENEVEADGATDDGSEISDIEDEEDDEDNEGDDEEQGEGDEGENEEEHDEEEEEEEEEEGDEHDEEEEVERTPRPRRGRPPKPASPKPKSKGTTTATTTRRGRKRIGSEAEEEPKTPKKRGRPVKNKQDDAPITRSKAAPRRSTRRK